MGTIVAGNILYYTGQAYDVPYGTEGIVLGVGEENYKNKGLEMHFPGLSITANCYLSELSYTRPTLPGGHIVGDMLYYTGVRRDNNLNPGDIGHVVGPAMAELSAFEQTEHGMQTYYADLANKGHKPPTSNGALMMYFDDKQMYYVCYLSELSNVQPLVTSYYMGGSKRKSKKSKKTKRRKSKKTKRKKSKKSKRRKFSKKR